MKYTKSIALFLGQCFFFKILFYAGNATADNLRR